MGVLYDIQACNGILEKLIPKNNSVSISHPTDKIRVGSMEAALCNFWRHADKLYKALCTAWKCECLDQHSTHLELQPRLSASDQEVRLLLSTHTRNSVQSTLPVTVKIGQEPTEPSIRVSSQWGVEPGRAPGSKRNITVRFADTLSAGKQIITNPSPSFENQPINNLCTTLWSRSNLKGVSSIGYLRDQDGGEYHDRFYIHPGRPRNVTSKSLSELIGGGVRSRLTRRQRYYLAVTISSSFIQLKDTSWIPETLENPWSKKSIFILADAENPDIFLLDRPFITRRFIDVVSTSETQPRSQRILDVNRLGIMLLELCFNMSIESHPARLRYPPSDDPKTNTIFDLIAALEWRKDVNEEAGQDYVDAIEWCLVGCRMMPMADNGTGVAGNWRRQMLENVTLPLQNCFQCINSDGAFESSLNIHDSMKSGHALASSSAGALHDEHGSTGYSRTSTASSVVDSWDEDGLASRSDDFTQTSIDQSSEISDILSIYKVSRRDHDEPSIGALKVHTLDSPQDVVTEQWHHSPVNQPPPTALHEHSSSSHVEQHLVLSESHPFKCLCGKEFANLYTLERHVQSNNRLVPEYPCPECVEYQGKKGFMRRDDLVQHLRSFHKYEDGQLADFFASQPQYYLDHTFKDLGIGQQRTDRGPSPSHFPTRDMTANAAIEEIRRKAGLIECAIALLSYGDGEYEALSRTLATRFKLWISVNEIFEESLVDRFSATDDHSLLSLFVNKMGRLERILPDPLGDGPPFSPSWDDLQKSRHLIDSLHRVGEAMRIEFPANSLVLKIRNMLSGRESSLTDIINPSDVRQEITKSMLRLQPEQIESYVSQVCEDYRVVFATLVLLYKPGRIFGFIEEKISDDKLPITKEFLVKSQKRRGWRSDDAARFVHAQHMILDRLHELSSKDTKQELPETLMSSIPIRQKPSTPSLGSSTTLD